ncbi:MAG TPA: glycosyltransferase family 4 protein [Xanthobacteraceae bacterium]|jgi:glycosyltransferase involved in cell wall biosynthesis
MTLASHKLRILHTEASTGWGGQEIRILDEAAGLRARGHDVQVAAPAAAPIFHAARSRHIPAHDVSLDRRSIGSFLALSRVIGAFKPDVVVTHSSSDSWLAALVTRMPSRRAALVRTRHLSTPVARGSLNRWLYGRAPVRVVTTGEAIRDQLIKTLGLDPRAVVSIPTGADMSRFRPGDKAGARARLGLSTEAPIIGIVATLRSWKGHRFLIAAMNDQRLAHARLVIVGDGPQDPVLREQAASFGDRVLFVGQQDDVVPWLHTFDVFALPSTGNEGVPQALVQAMACGIPVVTTPVGAIPELVRDRETGLIVPPGDEEALAAAIATLLTDQTLAGRLAAAGRERVSAHFTAAAMLDRMEQTLCDAATGGSTG